MMEQSAQGTGYYSFFYLLARLSCVPMVANDQRSNGHTAQPRALLTAVDGFDDVPLAVNVSTVHVVGSHRVEELVVGSTLRLLVVCPLAQFAVGVVLLGQITHYFIVLDAQLPHQGFGAANVTLGCLGAGIDVALEAGLRLALFKLVAHAVVVGRLLPVGDGAVHPVARRGLAVLDV